MPEQWDITTSDMGHLGRARCETALDGTHDVKINDIALDGSTVTIAKTITYTAAELGLKPDKNQDINQSQMVSAIKAELSKNETESVAVNQAETTIVIQSPDMVRSEERLRDVKLSGISGYDCALVRGWT